MLRDIQQKQPFPEAGGKVELEEDTLGGGYKEI